jgi:hypothetical protein
MARGSCRPYRSIANRQHHVTVADASSTGQTGGYAVRSTFQAGQAHVSLANERGSLNNTRAQTPESARKARLERPEILDLARAVREIDDLRISGEEREIVRRGGRNREAVLKRDRRSGLQARYLDHPGRPRKVRCERGTKISQRLVSGPLALVTRHSVIDLHEVG